MVVFLQQYNAARPEQTGSLTRRQLNHWESCFDREGLPGLIDRRGGHNKGQSAIPDLVWRTFMSYYLTENRPTALSCYEFTAKACPGEQIPHFAAFQRRLKTVPQMTLDYYREGEKYYQDHLSPECLDYLYTASHRKGGLRLMVHQCQLAQNLAAALGEEMTVEHLEKAAIRMGIRTA